MSYRCLPNSRRPNQNRIVLSTPAENLDEALNMLAHHSGISVGILK